MSEGSITTTSRRCNGSGYDASVTVTVPFMLLAWNEQS